MTTTGGRCAIARCLTDGAPIPRGASSLTDTKPAVRLGSRVAAPIEAAMMAANMRTCVVVGAIVALAMPAWAEDVASYQVSGHAAAGVSDPRTSALDDAFARAVRSALSDLVSSDLRTARQSDLDREIVSRARRWVATFTVTKDDVIDGRRELMVAVQIDRDKIRDRLEQLNIALGGRAELPPAPTIAVDVRVTAPPRMRTPPMAGAGIEALTTVFRSAGMAVRRVTASGRAGRGDGAIAPRDDATGEAASAQLVAIADVAVGEPASIRGEGNEAMLVTANVHLSEDFTTPSDARTASDRSTHRVIAQQQATAAALVDDPRSGIQRALTLAATALLPRLPATRAPSDRRRDDGEPLVDPGVVLVRLPPGTSYPMVLAEQKFLAGAKGIRAATLRRLSPSGWVIGVTTNSSSDPTSSAAIARVAQIATEPPAPDVQVAVKVVRGIVEVTFTGGP